MKYTDHTLLTRKGFNFEITRTQREYKHINSVHHRNLAGFCNEKYSAYMNKVNQENFRWVISQLNTQIYISYNYAKALDNLSNAHTAYSDTHL